MYLAKLTIKNFRCFDQNGKTITFNKGLNVLVGENDSGKTAIIDSIRIALGTTDQNYYRFEPGDFYNEDQTREISISFIFEDLTEDEKAAFLECLSFSDDKYYLALNFSCKYVAKPTPRTISEFSSGPNGDGHAPTQLVKELLKTTYLRPLRDSFSDMTSGRGSRLSQILSNVDKLNDGIKEYSEGTKLEDLSITGIANLSNKLLKEHSKLKQVSDSINEILTEKMLLAGDDVSTEIQVSDTRIDEKRQLSTILEKLDLSSKKASNAGRVGLGTSNILSMACELLLNRSPTSSLLLIEEPEAHIHAQRQLRLIQSLDDEARSRRHQIIVTTHSPLLASVVDLKSIIIVKNASAFSLSKDETMLEDDDYYFLGKYLDATKANLFFAKSVLIVEGPSEELLFPTIAKILGKDFTQNGVSMVNARGVGLKRFAGIFKRKNNSNPLGIKVACVTDRDVMPDCAPAICIDKKYKTLNDFPEKGDRKWRTVSEIDDMTAYVKNKCEKNDGQSVKTFVSGKWTLEYDLAISGFLDEIVKAVVATKGSNDCEQQKIKDKLASYNTLEEKCSYVYSLVQNISKPEVAQQFARLIENEYLNKPDKKEDFISKLPKYILEAINFVVGK